MYGMDGRAVEETLPAICTPIRVMDLEEEAEHCSTNMIALLFLHGTGTDTRGGEAVLSCLFDCVFFSLHAGRRVRATGSKYLK